MENEDTRTERKIVYYRTEYLQLLKIVRGGCIVSFEIDIISVDGTHDVE
jgi:hypothetical protein